MSFQTFLYDESYSVDYCCNDAIVFGIPKTTNSIIQKCQGRDICCPLITSFLPLYGGY